MQQAVAKEIERRDLAMSDLSLIPNNAGRWCYFAKGEMAAYHQANADWQAYSKALAGEIDMIEGWDD